MLFGNDIANSYTMVYLNDRKCKYWTFTITEEKDLVVIIDHKLNFVCYTSKESKYNDWFNWTFLHSLRQNIFFVANSIP